MKFSLENTWFVIISTGIINVLFIALVLTQIVHDGKTASIDTLTGMIVGFINGFNIQQIFKNELYEPIK